VEELRQRLGRWFANVEIWGMRFYDPIRAAAHRRSVEAACAGYTLFGDLWWNPWINRFYRWALRGGVWNLLRGRDFVRWSADDFRFEREELERAIWFVAVARTPVAAAGTPDLPRSGAASGR
jgi:hypothetical protein